MGTFQYYGSDGNSGSVEFEVKIPGGLCPVTTCVVDVDLFQKGQRVFPCGSGDDYRLTDADAHTIGNLLRKKKIEEEFMTSSIEDMIAEIREKWKKTSVNMISRETFGVYIPSLCNTIEMQQASLAAYAEAEERRLLARASSKADGMDIVTVCMDSLITEYGAKANFVISGQEMTASELLNELKRGTKIGDDFRADVTLSILHYLMKFRA
jgi:hypothetical protein